VWRAGRALKPGNISKRSVDCFGNAIKAWGSAGADQRVIRYGPILHRRRQPATRSSFISSDLQVDGNQGIGAFAPGFGDSIKPLHAHADAPLPENLVLSIDHAGNTLRFRRSIRLKVKILSIRFWCIGVAPAGARRAARSCRGVSGNMDARKVPAGNTLYLP